MPRVPSGGLEVWPTVSPIRLTAFARSEARKCSFQDMAARCAESGFPVRFLVSVVVWHGGEALRVMFPRRPHPFGGLNVSTAQRISCALQRKARVRSFVVSMSLQGMAVLGLEPLSFP